MPKTLKSRNGITLVEVIVSMLLFSIIVISATSIMVPMLRLFTKSNDLAECNSLLDSLANQIINDLSASTSEPKKRDKSSLSAHTGTLIATHENEVLITIGNSVSVIYSVDVNTGVLCKQTANGAADPVLTKNFYKGKSVNFTCTANGPEKAYTLTISILSDRDGTEMIRREYMVKPLVLNQYHSAP